MAPLVRPVRNKCQGIHRSQRNQESQKNGTRCQPAAGSCFFSLRHPNVRGWLLHRIGPALFRPGQYQHQSSWGSASCPGSCAKGSFASSTQKPPERSSFSTEANMVLR